MTNGKVQAYCGIKKLKIFRKKTKQKTNRKKLLNN